MAPAEMIEEFDLIARFFRPLAADSPYALGLQDDAAVLQPGEGNEVVVTTDSLSENVHFRSEDAPETVAARALGSNMSDLAAMGAEPIGYTLAVAAPDGTPALWFETFAKGLKMEQERYGTRLIGGDTTASKGGMMLTITAVGRVPLGQAVQRSTAKTGDDIWVTGTIGDAALGLDILQHRLKATNAVDRDALIERFNRPTARLAAVPMLRKFATAAIDVSDGLLADLGHLARASGLSACVSSDSVPISGAARRLLEQPGVGGRGMLERILTGGDDYEVIFAAKPDDHDSILQTADTVDLAVTRIGTVTAPAGGHEVGHVTVLDSRGEALIIAGAGGYRHFSDKA